MKTLLNKFSIRRWSYLSRSGYLTLFLTGKATMHKRSYVRLTQEEREWARVAPQNNSDSDSLCLPSPKKVRWTSGNRRDQQTRVLNAYVAFDNKKMFLNTFLRDREPFSVKDRRSVGLRCETYLQQTYRMGRRHALSRSKNSCLFSGKGSTYNRFLFVSRQTLRSLTRFGLVSGLISGKRG